VMVEAGANQLPEETVLDCIFRGHEEIQKLIAAQREIATEKGVVKPEWQSPEPFSQATLDATSTAIGEALRSALHTKGKFERATAVSEVTKPYIETLPADIQAGIAEQGLRNSHLAAIAPTGTISLLANNVSSGIEPVFDFQHRRQIRGSEGTAAWHELTDYALAQWRARFSDRVLPGCFVDAHRLLPGDHLAMKAALQPFVDNAISKTINIPGDYDFDAYRSVYEQAFRLGLKGCTTFRPNPVTGSVLEIGAGAEIPDSHCCNLDRADD